MSAFDPKRTSVLRIVAAQNDGRNAIPHSAGRRDEENLWFSTFCTFLHGCVVGEWTEPKKAERRSRRKTQSSASISRSLRSASLSQP